ncbi:MAG TPA: M48 family metallopeptidase [Chitinophagaceae bacterium]|nr:M48 family metallopeptidase [Chitinophagaceae bacterium]
MKQFFITWLVIAACSSAQAQFKINTKTIDATTKAAKAVTFSDADAANYAKQAVEWMDQNNPVAAPNDPYAIRLNKLFSKHLTEDGLPLNFKVYKVSDINACACADGSVRVFSALMDIMIDDELLAIIGHEIGHVKNHDTRDAIKAAYTRAAGRDILASQSGAAAALTDSQLGQLAEGLMGSSHSRKQESEADNYSYEFIKKHGYNVMGAHSAFMKLAKLSAGDQQQTKLQKMMSSHPDSQKRAEEIERKAKEDGLWKVVR